MGGTDSRQGTDAGGGAPGALQAAGGKPVAEKTVTGDRKHRFRMELDPVDPEPWAPDPHDRAVLGPGADLQTRAETAALDHERVVTSGRERVGSALEDAPAIVIDL